MNGLVSSGCQASTVTERKDTASPRAAPSSHHQTPGPPRRWEAIFIIPELGKAGLRGRNSPVDVQRVKTGRIK